MIEIAWSVGGFLVALGILVTVHEYGHFWVARRLGIKVLRFSVGFGRPLWSWRAGADRTEIVVAVLPLGGYVKMVDENEGEVAPEDLPRAFNRQALWKRTLVVLAGPLANFLFAVFAYWMILMMGSDGIVPVVGKVDPGSLAERSGFRPGERIVATNGRPTATWGEHRMYLFNKALAGDAVIFKVRAETGQVLERRLDFSTLGMASLTPAFLELGAGLYGVGGRFPSRIDAVTPGGAAAAAGLRAGDRVVSLDGRPVDDWQDIVPTIQQDPQRSLRLGVDRDGQVFEVELLPQLHQEGGQTSGRIGVRFRQAPLAEELRATVRYGPVYALWRGAGDTWTMISLTGRLLIRMATLELSSEYISGPLTIAQVAGQTARLGLTQFLSFLALVSISLGILNLLPVPVLDGGHLLYYAVEAIRGKPLSGRVMIWGQQIGILLLVGLMLLAFRNDFVRLFS